MRKGPAPSTAHSASSMLGPSPVMGRLRDTARALARVSSPLIRVFRWLLRLGFAARRAPGSRGIFVPRGVRPNVLHPNNVLPTSEVTRLIQRCFCFTLVHEL